MLDCRSYPCSFQLSCLRYARGDPAGVIDAWLSEHCVPGVLDKWPGAPGGLGISINGCPVKLVPAESRDDYTMVETSSGNVEVTFRRAR